MLLLTELAPKYLLCRQMVLFLLTAMKMKRIHTFLFGLFFALTALSQEKLVMPAIPPMHLLLHEYIVHSLDSIARLKNKTDAFLPITPDKELNAAIDSAVRTCVTNMRAEVELSTKVDDNSRFKWLRGINEMLSDFISGYRLKTITGTQLPALVTAYRNAMHADWDGNSVFEIVAENEPETGRILIDNYALKNNIGIAPARDIVVLKSCQRKPENVFAILNHYPDCIYADSLLIRAAYNNPEDLYTYAAASNALGKKIRAMQDPLVKIVAELAKKPAGRMYFPFLDNLFTGKTTMADLEPFVVADSAEQYYKLLVKTRIEYVERMQHGDTPMAVQVLTNRLKSKGIELYINEINALHDISNESIRFRKIDQLTPAELYYLAVLGEEEIYTSSFVNGVYPRILQRLRNPRSDSLFQLLHYDYYKKFLKLCASYNTLDNFLDKMDKSTAQNLMRSFVDGLDNTKTLEDAVDVANSYASIYNDQIRNLILEQVQKKLKESRRQQNQRGETIYNLLNLIFLSGDSTNRIDVSERLGIKPVYTLPNQSLRDTAGRIIIQQFLYGDKGGPVVLSAFLSRFSANPNWRITRKANWVEVKSVKGVPITIYSNLPLDETKDLDERSKDSLEAYLDSKDLEPSIVIHRGHSYSLRATISRLPDSAKLILLGSCGGYQSLHKVLARCPDANIIASKQVGKGVINQGMIDIICESLRLGKDLNWPSLWESLQGKFSGDDKEKFDDYVPPYKNLGAIFIMAYNKAMIN
jgi:hypothetical protein